jgi:hypothetical protein
VAYAEQMWDRIPKVNTYNNLGRESLMCLRTFSEAYTRVLTQFADGLKECARILDADCWIKPASQTTVGNGHPPTLEHSVYWLVSGLDNLATEIAERAQQMN